MQNYWLSTEVLLTRYLLGSARYRASKIKYTGTPVLVN